MAQGGDQLLALVGAVMNLKFTLVAGGRGGVMSTCASVRSDEKDSVPYRTNSLEQSTSESNSSSADQGIPNTQWNPNVHYHIKMIIYRAPFCSNKSPSVSAPLPLC